MDLRVGLLPLLPLQAPAQFVMSQDQIGAAAEFERAGVIEITVMGWHGGLRGQEWAATGLPAQVG